MTESVDIGGLFDAHAPYLLRIVERLTGSQAAAEDIVQEVFLIAWRKRAVLAAHPEPRGWLVRAAINRVRHHQRSYARLHRFLDDYFRSTPTAALDPGQAVERMEQARRIRRCVLKLPLKQREVFVLYELEEVEGARIAEVLDISINTVWSRLRLARERFQRTWEKT